MKRPDGATTGNSVVSELESDKPLAQIAREHCIHPSLPCRWSDELAENPERAFSGDGNRCKHEARIAELDWLPGQAHAENVSARPPTISISSTT
ncbi:hypothetical protein ASZ90_012326 [hydrocarbon metagenome]|mgnify:CR=1 FL=1|uniref:Transposase n=1 Tax=hydrocarbon metagenome TaxID=938273 RepID=A0A0W8FAQ0_9ZZZZ